jgi:hypothetical protein
VSGMEVYGTYDFLEAIINSESCRNVLTKLIYLFERKGWIADFSRWGHSTYC